MANYPFAPLPTPQEIAHWDAATYEESGIPPAVLMENAGQASINYLIEKTGPLAGKKVIIFMGGGNNGGDGAVIARLAFGLGAKVLVCHLHQLPDADCANANAAQKHIALALASGVTFHKLTNAFSPFPGVDWESPDIVIDALLGTGFKPPMRSEYTALIKRINMFRNLKPSNCAGGCSTSLMASDAQWPGLAWPKKESPIKVAEPFVLAIDIPSGLCGVSGEPRTKAVAAHATITFETPKPGLIMPVARPFVGEMHVAPVGIAHEVKQRYLAKMALLLPDCTAVTPNPYNFEHKNAAGKLLIIGGSEGMSGAPVLAALAAYRAGAGRVAIACPALLDDQVKNSLPDVLTIPLGNSKNWTLEAASNLAEQLNAWDAVVIGPGMGTNDGACEVVKTVLETASRPPLLVDADALNIIAQNPELSDFLRWQDVLTPHPGEAGRLLGIETRSVQKDRLDALCTLLKKIRANVVLKGMTSLIGSGERIALSPFIEPNLALAGSGDVLSGILGTYLAQGISVFEAACAAVYLHGMAGHLLKKPFPFRGNLPSDIANILPDTKLALAGLPADWVPDLNENIINNTGSSHGSCCC